MTLFVADCFNLKGKMTRLTNPTEAARRTTGRRCEGCIGQGSVVRATGPLEANGTARASCICLQVRPMSAAVAGMFLLGTCLAKPELFCRVATSPRSCRNHFRIIQFVFWSRWPRWSVARHGTRLTLRPDHTGAGPCTGPPRLRLFLTLIRWRRPTKGKAHRRPRWLAIGERRPAIHRSSSIPS